MHMPNDAWPACVREGRERGGLSGRLQQEGALVRAQAWMSHCMGGHHMTLRAVRTEQTRPPIGVLGKPRPRRQAQHLGWALVEGTNTRTQAW